MTKIVVAGSKGRMGSLISEIIRKSSDLSLAAEADIGTPLESAIDKADVVIDFTVAEAAAANAEISARHRKPIVIGTTGLNDAQLAAIREASRQVAVVHSPNMSIGVNLLWKLVEIAAKTLSRQYKVDIVETHHIHKLDRPSGTAKKILDIILKESGRRVDQDVFFAEEELPQSQPPEDMDVSLRSIRRGEVVGDHAVHFTNPGETISIIHHAASRNIFAEGAVAAARWIVGKPAGLYGMDDVLNLR